MLKPAEVAAHPFLNQNGRFESSGSLQFFLTSLLPNFFDLLPPLHLKILLFEQLSSLDLLRIDPER